MLKIIFEFVGGPCDGEVCHGQLGEPNDAERYYLFTNRGNVGHRFKVASPYTVNTLADEQLRHDRRHNFQRHFYVVTNRLEDEEQQEVWVRAEYIPDVN